MTAATDDTIDLPNAPSWAFDSALDESEKTPSSGRDRRRLQDGL